MQHPSKQGMPFGSSGFPKPSDLKKAKPIMTLTPTSRYSPPLMESNLSKENWKSTLRRNYYRYKIKEAAHQLSFNPDQELTQLFGMLNVLSHRLAYVEDKLNCRDEMPTVILLLDDFGESSTDEIDSPVYAEIPALWNKVRAAQTTAQSVNMELPFPNGSQCSADSFSSGGSTDSGGEYFNIRVRIPETDSQNYLSFRRDKTIWYAKMQLLKSLIKPLTDSLNFGFYLPPSHGKAGKFLEEERLFSDYPTDPVNMPYLEFKYKRRVYKQLKLDIKEVKKYHNKTNLKTFFDSVRSRNVDKINKMTAKCMDPNIMEESTGETPLTIAASMKNSEDVIRALISGGAHLDFRTREGKTVMHHAVKAGNHSTLELLLGLGASPNYKDYKGITPLYYNVQRGGEPMIAELLLKDRSDVDISDEQGWREIHHACRYGRVQHLQLLMYYGANINCQNEAGNTPLHICAAYDQESAARLLLFRGGDRALKNKSSQTAFQVAIVTNNFSLGETIKNFLDEDVVLQQEVPTYNNRRRASSLKSDSPGVLSRTISEPFLPGSRVGAKMSVASSVSSFSEEDSIAEEPTTPIRSGSMGSLGRSAALAKMVHQRVREVKTNKLYICVRDYSAQEYGELTLMKGDYVKVHSIGVANFWEGEVGNSRGWFPSHCVQEVTGKEKAQTMRERKANYSENLTSPQGTKEPEPREVFVERRKKGFGFILRGAKSPQGTTSAFRPTKDFPALQYLEHVDKGSPADKAGLQKGDFILEINSQDVTSAPHQYVVSLVVNSPDTIFMKVITLPNSKALAWLNEAKKNSIRKKPPPSHTSLTKTKGEKAQQEIQALNELDDAIAKAEKPTDDKTESPFASIRKRPLSKKLSPEHLSAVFQRQGSAPAGSGLSQDEQRAVGLKKPVIPLAPSAYRFNTVARMSAAKTHFPSASAVVSPSDTITMETQTHFEDDAYDSKSKRRNSGGSDSAVSSLRSSPASSYSYTTTVSNDSGMYMRFDTTQTDSASNIDSIMSQLPPAPDYPAPSIPPAPNYPAPIHPNIRVRSKSLHNLQNEQSMGERRMSTGQKRPNKAPPPIPQRDSSISEGNLSRLNSAEKTRPASLIIPRNVDVPEPPDTDSSDSDFANAIAAAAQKKAKLRKANSFDSLELKTPLQLALEARDQSMGAPNQNRNQNAETTASQGSPQLALNEAIAKRKAHLDAKKDPNENIENKIRRYKQADSAKNNSANQALLSAIAKRRSTIEKQLSEDSDSQSTGSEGSSKIEAEKNDSTEHKSASTASGNKETETTQAAASWQTRIVKKAPLKEPTSSFSNHKNVIKIAPHGDINKSSSPATSSPKDKPNEGTSSLQEADNTSVQSLKHNFEKNGKPDTYKHCLSPVRENEDFLPPPPPAFLNSNSPQAESDSLPHLPTLADHRREGSFDSASVVSSMSSMSTMSSYSTVSTEPNSEHDDDPTRTNTMKSTSSVSSNSTVTSKGSKPSPLVLPKPKRKSQILEDNSTSSSSTDVEVLDNQVINAVPSPDVDNKHSMTSAWNEQGSNANETEGTAEWCNKPLSSWTPYDVGLWLASLNLSEHRGSFEENEIAGEHLQALGKEDLQELGIGRMGHRLTIMKAIKQLKG